jgi:hypothetical protein
MAVPPCTSTNYRCSFFIPAPSSDKEILRDAKFAAIRLETGPEKGKLHAKIKELMSLDWQLRPFRTRDPSQILSPADQNRYTEMVRASEEAKAVINAFFKTQGVLPE